MTAETNIVTTTAEETNHFTIFKWLRVSLPFWVTTHGWLLVSLCVFSISPIVKDWWFHLVWQGLR
jgi:hypothetical protein